MNSIKFSLFTGCLFALFIGCFTSSCSQSQNSSPQSQDIVGGKCQGCEAVYEYRDISLTNSVTLPDYEHATEKLKITGTIYQKDGQTPAKDVILYIYHTDANGIYAKKGNESGWGERHGYIRGWLKTDETGKYTIHTFRPASYPNTTIVAHIHAVILESGLNPYYIDDFLFDDDQFLSEMQRNNSKPKAGSGVMKLSKNEDIPIGMRDIYLGKNIENYPIK